MAMDFLRGYGVNGMIGCIVHEDENGLALIGQACIDCSDPHLKHLKHL